MATVCLRSLQPFILEVARLVDSAKDALGWQANGWMRIEPREIEPSPLPPIAVGSPAPLPARDERLIAEGGTTPTPTCSRAWPLRRSGGVSE